MTTPSTQSSDSSSSEDKKRSKKEKSKKKVKTNKNDTGRFDSVPIKQENIMYESEKKRKREDQKLASA